MSTTEIQPVNGQATNITMTDVAEQNKPAIISLTQEESDIITACQSELRQAQEQAQRAVNIASNQLGAYIYSLAAQKGVDLSVYEFSVAMRSFVKK